MEIEKIENLLKKSPVQTIVMHRINYGGHRLYIREEPFEVFSGLTRALDASRFRGNQDAKRLDRWRDSMLAQIGKDARDGFVGMTADFGTLVHEVCVRMWESGKLEWEKEQEYAHQFFRQSAIDNNMPVIDSIISQQVYEYCKAAAALMAFFHERVTELYAVEAMAFNADTQIATPIDLYGLVRPSEKASPVPMVINIKTSNAITPHHLEQVSIEANMWSRLYGPDELRAAILRPKDWKENKQPTYELKVVGEEDQHNLAMNAYKRMEICRSSQEDTYLSFPKSQPIFTGETKLGENPNIQWRTLQESFFELREKLVEA